MEKKELEKIVKKLKSKIRTFCGNNLNKVILFGSYARGDAQKSSDIDLLILLNKYSKKDEEKIRDIIFKIELKFDVVISALIYEKSVWESTPYKLLEIHYWVEKEGIPV